MSTNIGLWKLALDLVSEKEASLGVSLSLSDPITFPLVRKMRAQGCAASVTFACERTVWRGLKLSCTTSTSVVTSGVISRMTAWMVGLNNNFCVEFTLVVSVAEILLVMGVAILESLFGSLPSTANFSESLIASTCSAESFLNQFLASTCSLESIIVSTC